MISRPRFQLAAIVVLVFAACTASAERRTLPVQREGPGIQLAQQSSVLGVVTMDLLAHAWSDDLGFTLPPQEKPTTHWPWWLRILAVIGILFFIRMVAGAVRTKPSGPGQS